MKKVTVAATYRAFALGSRDTTKNMLITQFQFPQYVDEDKDVHIGVFTSYLILNDGDNSFPTLRKFFGKITESSIEYWARENSHEKVFEFIKEMVLNSNLLTAKYQNVEWTGFRITASVNQNNGYPDFKLELFQNNSGTKVYTSPNAPNVAHKEFPQNTLGDAVGTILANAMRK